ncbi:LPS export ABC transporter periplasmic protein LptC [Pseudoprimorskyibacter insulae]|uniref:Lipopolysaccharide export system protein LptC n=1 Tax=Pseudoprimorskyibacter insulae TaxID=1695997 RepID=A0A2R8ATG9_9RHOB|nr:LPS export ABC transporter periplasmic protein LptC [Pseudoprimorskyibacter insulae]SPF79363.1 hypothetical protein PRI8871_01158 [Pseudoprimorskyibacter insulae]
MRRDNTYSRVIAWLKILFPLTALGLLSTVFLLSEEVAKVGELPFADRELKDRVANQQITAPHFSGVTAEGDRISFTATSARPAPGSSDAAIGETVSGALESDTQGTINMRSDQIEVQMDDNMALLTGGVQIASSQGYSVTTAAMRTALNDVYVETLAPVEGTGPEGQFAAGKLIITTTKPDGRIQLLFTEGVKLVYLPRQNQE